MGFIDSIFSAVYCVLEVRISLESVRIYDFIGILASNNKGILELEWKCQFMYRGRMDVDSLPLRRPIDLEIRTWTIASLNHGQDR